LRPKASGGTNLVGLGPLRLRLVDAFLQDLRNRCALFTLQPRSNHLLPRITIVAGLLLIAGHLYQVCGVKPPDAARFESDFGFRPQLVTVAGESMYVDPTAGDRPETPPSSFVTQVGAVVDGTGEHALAGRFHQTHSVGRMEAISGPTHEGFDPRHLSVVEIVQLGKLDNPNSASLHGCVFAAQICQFIGEVLAATVRNAVDFRMPCGPSRISEYVVGGLRRLAFAPRRLPSYEV
jgi:hypothetical protein